MITPKTEDTLPAAINVPTSVGSARDSAVLSADSAESRQLSPAPHQPNNLTLPRTPLVGRDHELAAIQLRNPAWRWPSVIQA